MQRVLAYKKWFLSGACMFGDPVILLKIKSHFLLAITVVKAMPIHVSLVTAIVE